MEQRVNLDSRGVSLIEMLVAMTILLFVSLAMMQVALVSIESNMKNALRDEGTRLASYTMNEIRSLSPDELADLIANPPAAQNVQSRIRKQLIDYQIQRAVDDVSGYSRVVVTVQWDWRGETYSTTMRTLI